VRRLVRQRAAALRARRPLFVRGRVFALMGYEIVEGRVAQKRLIEIRRVNYSPLPLQIAR